MRSRGRVIGLSVFFFIVHHFLGCSGVLDLFKDSFGSVKIVFVNKLAFLCPAFESDHVEAQKSLFSCHMNNLAFSTKDKFQFNRYLLVWRSLPLSVYGALLSAVYLVSSPVVEPVTVWYLAYCVELAVTCLCESCSSSCVGLSWPCCMWVLYCVHSRVCLFISHGMITEI